MLLVVLSLNLDKISGISNYMQVCIGCLNQHTTTC